MVANINFQEELFDLEHSATHLVSRTSLFNPPSMVKCQYVDCDIKVFEYENREPKIASVDYGMLVPISEIKNNLDIETSIVPRIVGFPMQKHDDQHKMGAHALAIYSSTQFSFSLVASQRRPNVPKLTRAPVVSVSNYIQKLPNVNGYNLTELSSHLAQAPIQLTVIGVDPHDSSSSRCEKALPPTRQARNLHQDKVHPHRCERLGRPPQPGNRQFRLTTSHPHL